MIIASQFDDSKPIEQLVYPFCLKEVQSLNVLIHDCPFEHVFVLIKDPQQHVRALFTFKTRIKSYFLGRTLANCSNGALAGEIVDGEWSLVIIKPSLRAHGRFQIEIRTDRQLIQLGHEMISVLDMSINHIQRSGHHKWLNGDLHMHSYYSDGRESLEEISGYANQYQMGYLAVTDHAIVTTQFPKGDYVVIPATEITCDNECHYNVFGLSELIDYSRYFSEQVNINQALAALFDDLRVSSAVLSFNHPFADGMSLGHDVDMTVFDCIEVINAPHLVDEFIDNEKAIRFFDFLWSQGHYLFAVGGSDAHKKSDGGYYPILKPQTVLFVEQASIRGVLTAIKSGHALIINGISASLRMRDAADHEILPGTEQPEGLIQIDASSSTCVCWRILMNGQCIYQTCHHHLAFSVQLTANSVLRVEAKIGTQTVFFANPIFSALHRPIQTTSLQELLSKFHLEEKI